MLVRRVKIQLVVFSLLTLGAIVSVAVNYLDLPRLLGFNQYRSSCSSLMRAVFTPRRRSPTGAFRWGKSPGYASRVGWQPSTLRSMRVCGYPPT